MIRATIFAAAFVVAAAASDSADMRLAQSLAAQADALRGQGKHVEASELYVRALEIMDKALPGDDMRLAKALDGFSMSLEGRGWYEDSAKMGLYAARIYATVYGPQALEVAQAAERLARVCAKGAKYAQAGAYYDQALAIREKVQGKEHKDILPLLEEYAAMLGKTPRKADLARVEARAKSLRSRLGGAADIPRR